MTYFCNNDDDELKFYRLECDDKQIMREKQFCTSDISCQYLVLSWIKIHHWQSLQDITMRPIMTIVQLCGLK